MASPMVNPPEIAPERPELVEDEATRLADAVIAESEPVAPVTRSTHWLAYGLAGLGIVIMVLLLLQFLMAAPVGRTVQVAPVSVPPVGTPITSQG